MEGHVDNARNSLPLSANPQNRQAQRTTGRSVLPASLEPTCVWPASPSWQSNLCARNSESLDELAPFLHFRKSREGISRPSLNPRQSLGSAGFDKWRLRRHVVQHGGPDIHERIYARRTCEHPAQAIPAEAMSKIVIGAAKDFLTFDYTKARCRNADRKRERTTCHPLTSPAMASGCKQRLSGDYEAQAAAAATTLRRYVHTLPPISLPRACHESP